MAAFGVQVFWSAFGSQVPRRERKAMSVTRYHRQQACRPGWWLSAAFAAILTFGCVATSSFTPTDTATVDRLLGLIKERLDLAPEVARTKWNTKAPIEDLPREKQIIDGVANGATEYGLDPKVAGAFFTGQIEASKVVQNALHAEWTAKRQPPFEKVADLGRDIRPLLDRLTPAMMKALAEAVPVLGRPGGRELLDARSKTVLGQGPWGEAAVREAVAPLRELSK
jgi:chorismate mutase